MVYDTRKVVEDFVLYKIKQRISLTNNGTDFAPTQMQQSSTGTEYAQFPSPQDPPNEINRAVRKVADDYEERYEKAYPDLLDGISAKLIGACDVDKMFSKITRDLFQIQVDTNVSQQSVTSSSSGGIESRKRLPGLGDPDSVESHIESLDDEHIKWGHVIGLLVLTEILAVRCVEINKSERVNEMVNWVSNFLDTRLGPWIRHHGGWEGFAEWYRQGSGAAFFSWLDKYQIGQDMRTALGIGGAFVVIALTAAMLSRK